MTSDIEQAIKEAPPSWQNNKRQIIREAIARFNKNPSERYADQVERLTGISADWSDADHGTGQRGTDGQD